MNLLVLLPTNSMEGTRERLVEIKLDEERKTGISSLKNIGMQLFTGAFHVSMIFKSSLKWVIVIT